jgi:hypothetical protein
LRNCTCETPEPSGTLNGGVEICMNCGWEITRTKNVYRLQGPDGQTYNLTTREAINARIERGWAEWVGTDYDEKTDTYVHYADRIT